MRTISVYTDGSVSNNGKGELARGGIGVYYSKGNSLNVSEPFFLRPITNQRAELYAIIKSIENLFYSLNNTFTKSIMKNDGQIENNVKVKIYSDSEYSINCVTKWIEKWKRKGWKTVQQKNVKNRDLIEWLYYLIHKYAKSEIEFEFIHVSSHQDAPKDKESEEYKIWYGNDVADKFAVDGRKISEKLNPIEKKIEKKGGDYKDSKIINFFN
jgi:ribonuclease HI